MKKQNTQFVVVNAFAEQPFGGNPAAVFMNADGLDDNSMQAFARQLNLVETVFVFAGENNIDRRLKYFTPAGEIPVAGHPSIAAWIALLYKQVIHVQKRHSFIQGNLAGTQEIEINCTQSGPPIVTMRQPEPRFLEGTNNTEQVASVFGLNPDEIRTDLPIRAVDTGLGHVIIPLRSLESLFKVKRHIEPLRELCESLGVREAQLFCFEAQNKTLDMHTRNICPREGIEDPACGVGNGALAAYISQYLWPTKTEINLRIEQGQVTNMPSIIYTRTSRQGQNINVYIGGTGTVMLEGNFVV